MNFNKQNIKRVIDSFLIETKNQCVGTDDLWSMPIRCCKNDDNVKEESNTESTRKFEKQSDSKKKLEEFFDNDSVKLIYTSPQAFQDLTTLFKCKNKTAKSSIEKPDMPCTCENCAVISIIRDSQQIVPFASEIIHCPRNKERGNNRDNEREKRNKTPSKQAEYAHYKQLLNRIIDLEERLKVQEETSVPKAEFKKLITRQCQRTNQVRHSENYRKTYNDSFNSQPPMVSEDDRPGSSKKPKPSLCDKKTSPITTNYHFWKWGEDILKPGIDIKNKIKLLIEDAVKKCPKGVNKPGGNSKSFIVNAFNYIFHNDKAAPETKTPVSIIKNIHYSDDSLRILYINPGQWKESVNSSASDINLRKTSHSLNTINKEKFIQSMDCTSQTYKQRLWNAVQKQCLVYGYDKRHIATIQFPVSQGNTNLDISVKCTIEELENVLIGKNASIT